MTDQTSIRISKSDLLRCLIDIEKVDNFLFECGYFFVREIIVKSVFIYTGFLIDKSCVKTIASLKNASAGSREVDSSRALVQLKQDGSAILAMEVTELA
jgi:hypothetical protein